MKLNPPASSSDIEVAREIARRLHQRRRRDDRPMAPQPPGPATRATTAPASSWTPPPWQPVPPAPEPQQQPRPPAAQAAPVPPRHAAEEPAPPSWDAIAVASPRERPEARGPEDALDALTAPALPEPPPAEPEPPAAAVDLDEESSPEADALSEPVSPMAFDEADAYGGSPEPSPFDGADALTPPDLDTPDLGAADGDGSALDSRGLGDGPFDPTDLGADASFSPAATAVSELDVPAPTDLAVPEVALEDEAADEEELFDERPGPSWGEIVESCLTIAHARGALLASSGGELVAARGEWPDPGAEAIASRLVTMMDRTLKDAPTRSVSAPVGNLHLTAWRVPVDGRLLTVVFIADSQVRSEARSAIDAEVQRGAAA
jgi:hypothetical protein